MKKALILLPLSLLVSSMVEAIELYKDDNHAFQLKGFFRPYMSISDGKDELKDSSSRLGFHFQRVLPNDFTAFATLEWGVDIVNNEDQFSIGGDGFRPSGDGGNTIWNRLGFVGFANKELGQLAIGKQWSTYYMVTAWTDELEIYGGNASGTYNFGTDGGSSGTGRVQQAVQYKNSFGPVDVGLQYKSTTDSIDFDPIEFPGLESAQFDAGWGGAIVYHTPWHVGVGYTYNRSDIRIEPLGPAGALKTVDEAHAVGLYYGTLDQVGFYAAANYNLSKNHETDDAGKIFDAQGVELYAQYQFDSALIPYAAWNHLEPDDKDYQGQYKLQYVALGIKYAWVDEFVVFAEGKLQNSKSSNGTSLDDTYGIGLNYSF